MDVRQIVFTDANRAELLTVPGPDSLGEGQIRIETCYSLVSPGTELSWYSGIQREVAGDRFRYPIYSGYCHSGRVVEVSPDVEQFEVGDLIVSGAHHASQLVVSLEESEDPPHGDLTRPIRKVPRGLEARLAPFAKIGEIAMTAIRIAEFSLGDRVLVLGLGMVGNLTAQLFQLAGADVLGVDISPFRIQRARDCGVGNAVNSKEVDLEQTVREWSGGLGADVAVESVGSSELILESVALTRRLGEVIMLGTPRRKMQLNPSPHLWQAHMKGVRLKGALRCLFYPLHPRSYSRYSVADDLRQILQLMAEGRLTVEPLHTDTFKPEECQEAYRHIQKAGDRSLGVLFEWDEAV
jgi:2-desacetyl-2-hydroxyethyl bacteriochlorophyllide A dehydrogenase